MRYVPLYALAMSALVLTGAQAGPPAQPVAAVEPVTDSYFGTSVVDPYRWMEKGISDPRFLAYLKEQTAYTASVLAPLAPQRNELRDKLLHLSAAVTRIRNWNQAGGSLFYEQLDPAAAVAVLRVRPAGGNPRTLLDPANFAAAGSHAAIDYFSPSLDGSRVAVGVAPGGSEDDTIHIVDTATGQVLPDAITRTQYGSPSWRADGRSFYYSRLQALPAGAPPSAVYENQRVYLHRLGSNPDSDKVVFGPGVDPGTAVPSKGFNGVGVIPRTPYLLAFHSAGTTDPALIFVGREGSTVWTPLIRASDHLATRGSSPFSARGTKLYAILQNVPNGRIVAYDLAKPQQAPETVVPETGKIIEGIFAASDGLYVEYRDGIHFSLAKVSDSGTVGAALPLPYQGSIYGIDASPTEPGLRFGIDSWIRSPALFAYDPADGRVTDTGLIPKDPSDLSHLTVREVTAESTDGASVPISIILRDDMALDGTHPALFEGYGAYGISLDPAFSSTLLEWVRRGGVLAVAHVRGGGEYGERWHLAGQKETKQHTIDDMIARRAT
jgi:prolyl oligopeptidase